VAEQAPVDYIAVYNNTKTTTLLKLKLLCTAYFFRVHPDLQPNELFDQSELQDVISGATQNTCLCLPFSSGVGVVREASSLRIAAVSQSESDNKITSETNAHSVGVSKLDVLQHVSSGNVVKEFTAKKNILEKTIFFTLHKSTASNCMNSILLDLPEDVLRYIFRVCQFRLRDIAALSCTCQYLKHLVSTISFQTDVHIVPSSLIVNL
jgi:hypothetical protein